MKHHPIEISVSTWKYGKDWVYSITYDEGLSDLSRFVIPNHQEFGIPGHVEVVAGQIGEIRNCGQSSYNGMKHMDAGELRGLLNMGWGVGSHSWSHGIVMDNPELELLKSKIAIEEAIGHPVTVYTSCGCNDNLTPEVLEKIQEYGYLAGVSITDDINYPDTEDILWVNRVPIHEHFWGPFDSYFDAYKRIRQAQKEHGWIVDYCHCPLETPVHGYKDCSAAHHRERLQTIAEEGGASCWYANPDDVVDYRYMRRHAEIKRVDSPSAQSFEISLDGLPDQVVCRELTFEVRTPCTPESLEVRIGDRSVDLVPARAGIHHFTTDVHHGMQLTLSERK